MYLKIYNYIILNIIYIYIVINRELIDALHLKNVPVYLVSGGFRVIINPVAETLNIPIANVFANTLLFDENGTKNNSSRLI